MPPLLRALLIALLSMGLTIIIKSALIHGSIIIILTMLITTNSLRASLLQAVLNLLLGGAVTVAIVAMQYGTAWSGMVTGASIIAMTVALTLVLVDVVMHTAEGYYIPLLEMVTLLGTPLLVMWWSGGNVPDRLSITADIIEQEHIVSSSPQTVTATTSLSNTSTAMLQRSRLEKAIAGNTTAVQSELKQFGQPDSQEWQDGLGQKLLSIPQQAPWPMQLFFQTFPDDGNEIAGYLWGVNVANLRIADGAGTLQPLIQCRNAIRRLYAQAEQYTPFFQAADFGGGSTSSSNLRDKITAWVSGKEASLLAQNHCDAKPKVSEALTDWITRCLVPLQKVFTDDHDLQNIKAVGEWCGAVVFVTTN